MSIEELFLDQEVEDIVLKPRAVLFFKKGRWQKLESQTLNESELSQLIRVICEEAQVQLGLTQPSVDSFWRASKNTEFRAHIVSTPMIDNGPELTLRRLKLKTPFALEEFSRCEETLSHLREALRDSKNILISGATGSGKSSLISSLLNLCPSNERVLVLEDSPELPLPNEYSSKLLSRRNRFGYREGAEWGLMELLFESLRMRPDRIVLGECRGPEAHALLRALQIGHSGCLTSIHASSVENARRRFRELVFSASKGQCQDADSYWDLVLHLETQSNGKKELSEIGKSSNRSPFR